VSVYLALSKKPGDLITRLFMWRTGSPYGHCEIFVEDGKNSRYYGVCRVEGVGMRWRYMDSTKWDYVPLRISEHRVERCFATTSAEPYNWLGMLGLWLGLPFRMPLRWRRWRCSEWPAWVLGLDKPEAHTIRTLLQELAPSLVCAEAVPA
jgi:hypothetical protein